MEISFIQGFYQQEQEYMKGDGQGESRGSLHAFIEKAMSCAVQLVNDAPPTLKISVSPDLPPMRSRQNR